jgi:hypothetical protein
VEEVLIGQALMSMASFAAAEILQLFHPLHLAAFQFHSMVFGI